MKKITKILLLFVIIMTMASPVYGWYTIELPSGEEDVQTTIYKTDNVTGKMQTNDWWSNLAWDAYSQPQYPHPLAMQNQEDGMRIYYPGNRITAYSNFVAGWMNDIHDIVVGHSNVDTFTDTKVNDFSDWFVSAFYENGDNTITATYGHGSPFVYFTYTGGNPQLSFYTVPSVWSGDENSSVLGITMEGAHYGLYGATGSTWSNIDTTTFTNNLLTGQDYFVIAVLPDASEATLNAYKEYAYAFVTDTKVEWSYDATQSEVTTTFNYTTVAKEGTNNETIMCLYPHQYNYSNASLLSYTYPSVRGLMKTTSGTSFQTTMTFTGILPSLPDLGTYDDDTLAGYIDEAEAEVYEITNVDTYWVGKRLGKLATLAPIADQVGDTVAAEQFRNEIKEILEEWFTETDESGNVKTSSVFYYNSNWGTLIGYPDSYGSAEELNDHHFHYGYFIKAAAEIARVDETWASEWESMIELLIRDFASNNRNDDMFPFMRNFDPYEGHSWASGKAAFGDGNNNESSSEGMNAWAGIALWGEATGDTELRDFGIYMYTTEMNGINEYWFDVNNENHPEEFTRSTASMIWGGKMVGNATWWTDNTEEVHGINWLPFSGASLYLAQYPDYTEYNYETMVTENGSEDFDMWEDLMYMYRAISDSDSAKTLFDANVDDMTPETGNSKANVYHWIYNLDALGTIDNTITADYPLYAVFDKNGIKTYVVYNMNDTELLVTFSDGYEVTVAANSFSDENPSNGGEEEVVGEVDLYLMDENDIKYLSSFSGTRESESVITGLEDDPIIFTYEGLTATYDGGTTAYELYFDTVEWTVATAPQLSISYDFNGDGIWDRVETTVYFALDPIYDSWEYFTEQSHSYTLVGDDYEDFINGNIKVEIWNELGDASTTKVKVNASNNGTVLLLPYSY